MSLKIYQEQRLLWMYAKYICWPGITDWQNLLIHIPLIIMAHLLYVEFDLIGKVCYAF